MTRLARFRSVICYLRGRHRVAALLDGSSALVGCPFCRVGRRVPLARPPTPTLAEIATQFGVAVVDEQALVALQLALDVESSFTRMSGDES